MSFQKICFSLRYFHKSHYFMCQIWELEPPIYSYQFDRIVAQSCLKLSKGGLMFQFRDCQHITFVTLKVGLSPPKKFFYLHQWKPFKSDEKCFLFRLKSSFCSQDFEIFVLTFWSCRKIGFIRKIRLSSEIVQKMRQRD